MGFTLFGATPHFEALGSNIVVTAEGDTISPKTDSTQFVTLLYDTRTGTLDCGRLCAGSGRVVDKGWLPRRRARRRQAVGARG
jgi:hypothetical protein